MRESSYIVVPAPARSRSLRRQLSLAPARGGVSARPLRRDSVRFHWADGRKLQFSCQMRLLPIEAAQVDGDSICCCGGKSTGARIASNRPSRRHVRAPL